MKSFCLIAEMPTFLCVFRHQLQELRLKQEQKEREQRGGRRRDLQGETAGERVKPRGAPTQPPNLDCDAVSHYRRSVHVEPPEGVKQLLSHDGCFIFWMTPFEEMDSYPI